MAINASVASCSRVQCIIGCKGGGSDHLQWSGGDQAIQPDQQLNAVYTEQCGIVQSNVLQCGVGSLLMRCWLVGWGWGNRDQDQPIICCTIMKKGISGEKKDNKKKSKENIICDRILWSLRIPLECSADFILHPLRQTYTKDILPLLPAILPYDMIFVQNFVLLKDNGQLLLSTGEVAVYVSVAISQILTQGLRRLHVLLRFCSPSPGSRGFKVVDRADLAPRAFKQAWSITGRKLNQRKSDTISLQNVLQRHYYLQISFLSFKFLSSQCSWPLV